MNYLTKQSRKHLVSKYPFLRPISSMAFYFIHIKLQLLLERADVFFSFFFPSFQTKLLISSH